MKNPPETGEIIHGSHYHGGYFVGIRYYFIPWLGVFTEAGRNGFSIFTAGLSFRI